MPRVTPRAIFDTFPFFNELKILQLRFEELKNVVNEFVILESNLTFQGGSKPLYFLDNLNFLSPQLIARVTHVLVDDEPQTRDPWRREWFQKNAIARGLARAKDDDYVILADLDEIPRGGVIDLLRLCDGVPLAVGLRSATFVNDPSLRKRRVWNAPVVVKRALLARNSLKWFRYFLKE